MALNFTPLALWAKLLIAAIAGALSPLIGKKAFLLRVKQQDAALDSLAKGPWSDAAEKVGELRYTGVGDAEGSDVCE